MQFKRMVLVSFMVLSITLATFTIALDSAEAAGGIDGPPRKEGNPACGVIAGLAALLGLDALDMVLRILGCRAAEA